MLPGSVGVVRTSERWCNPSVVTLSIFLREGGGSLGIHRVGLVCRSELLPENARRVVAFLNVLRLDPQTPCWTLASVGLAPSELHKRIGVYLYADAIHCAAEQGAILLRHDLLRHGSSSIHARHAWASARLPDLAGAIIEDGIAASKRLLEATT